MQSQEERTEVSSVMVKSCPSASLAFVPEILAIGEPAGSGPAAAPRRIASHHIARNAARRWFLDAQPLISIDGSDGLMQATNGSCGRAWGGR